MRIERLSVILIAICMILGFALRMIPALNCQNVEYLMSNDSLYNLRLLETFLNTGEFIHFEVFTLFPTGQFISWGELFTIISSVFPILAGAVSRSDIANSVAFFTPILFLFIVPLMYLLGKKFGDWKTGVISALFVVVIGGQFFSRSVFGYYDHHILEMLFAVLICVSYILCLLNLDNKKKLILFSIIAGLSYLLGLLTMTTMVIFGLIISLYTLIQFIINFKKQKDSINLAISNSVVFGIAFLGLFIHGFSYSFDMYQYSLGVVLIQVLPIVGTWLLYGLSKLLKGKTLIWYISIIGGILIVSSIIFMIVSPDMWNMISFNLINHLLPSNSTIAEAVPWSFDSAVSSFRFGLILAFIGLIFVFKNIISKPECLFLSVWSICILLFTISQVRWEYFFAINIVILSAICVSKVINVFKKTNKDSLIKFFGIFIVLFALLFVGTSIAQDVNASQNFYNYESEVYSNWIEACNWLESNTPDIGLDYFGIYDGENFSYPEKAYGVLAWWDFGHHITYFGKRIPVSNPFQAGVTGEYGIAKILTETDEKIIYDKLKKLNVKYIMVDYDTAHGFLYAINAWANTNNKSNTFAQRLYDKNGKDLDVTLVYESSPNMENNVAKTVKIFEFNGLK